MLNSEVFKNISQAHKRILVVTKYFDTQKTQKIIQECYKNYAQLIFGYGENRIDSIKNKQLPREHVHFIGNIQSRNIAEIVTYCAVIHSLASIKHAQKIENQKTEIQAFIQIQVDEQKNIGILESELGDFIKQCEDFKFLTIIGISGMGSADISETKKREEFQKLVSLRDNYLPNGLISAGTSRDYEIALSESIDIVRVGSLSII